VKLNDCFPIFQGESDDGAHVLDLDLVGEWVDDVMQDNFPNAPLERTAKHRIQIPHLKAFNVVQMIIAYSLKIHCIFADAVNLRKKFLVLPRKSLNDRAGSVIGPLYRLKCWLQTLSIGGHTKFRQEHGVMREDDNLPFFG